MRKMKMKRIVNRKNLVAEMTMMRLMMMITMMMWVPLHSNVSAMD